MVTKFLKDDILLLLKCGKQACNPFSTKQMENSNPVNKRQKFDQEEDQIIQSIQAGETRFFTKLYDRYLKLIYRYVYARVGNQEEAEDITQDTFIKALAAIGNFKFRSQFKTWLFRICQATMMDMWRKKYKQVTVPLEDFLAHDEPFDIAFDDDSQEVEQKSKEIQLESVLGKLTIEYREILELRFLKGYTIKEAAAELSITISNAKVRQYRALKKAQQIIRENKSRYC